MIFINVTWGSLKIKVQTMRYNWMDWISLQTSWCWDSISVRNQRDPENNWFFDFKVAEVWIQCERQWCIRSCTCCQTPSCQTKIKTIFCCLSRYETFFVVNFVLIKLMFMFVELLPEFDGIDQSDPNCVVIGDAAEFFTYEILNKAFQLLTSMENPLLISMGKGYYFCSFKETFIFKNIIFLRRIKV